MTKKRMITQAGSAILLIALVSLLAACGAAPAAPTATPAPTQPPPPPTATPAPAATEPALEILTTTRTFDLDIKPHDIAVDGEGNLYAVDLQSAQIVKYDRDGKRLMAWGERGNAEGQFEFLPPPDGPQMDGGFVTVDEAGNVYVSDSYNNRVQKFDPEGNFLAMWSTAGAEDAPLNVPGPISIDALGRLYVADFSGLQQYDLNGAFVASHSAAGEAAVDSQGNLFMPLAFQNIVFRMDGNGEVVGQWGGQGRGDGQFDFPMLLVVDSHDRIYVSDQSGRIQRFDTEGAFQGKWFPASESGQPAALLLGMTIDGEDNLYVAAKDRTTVYVLREP
jgi:DNA-binding beta-propeller fold protein YncE